jgi:cellulose synthase/poly-beta-1,6-N-acetylglucosamine synthase-like glycosyltransferase
VIIFLASVTAILLLIPVSLGLAYQTLLCVAASFYRGSEGTATSMRRFLFLVPAHDEEVVLDYLLESIKAISYPQDKIQTVVVADNCTDSTAEVAERGGALTLQRTDPGHRGKAYAIDWAMDQLRSARTEFDVLVVLDADNLAPPDLLHRMNLRLEEGYQALQASVECKNPGDSLVTAMDYLVYSSINRNLQTGRSALGLNALLCGTGMAFTREILDKIQWADASLTEDRDLSMQLEVSGCRIAWVDEARIFDEKPIGFQQAVRQRGRWTSGWLSDLRRHLPGLTKAFFRRPRLAAVDSLFQLSAPMISISNWAALIPLAIARDTGFWYWWISAFILNRVIIGVGLWRNKAPYRYYGYLAISPLSTVINLGAALRALLSGRRAAWSHTKHTRAIRLGDPK